jgi:hypothetical protein
MILIGLNRSGADMRAVILILIVAIVAIIVAVASGFLNVKQTRSAEAPAISTTSNGVQAKGGRTPAFDVETGSVSIGSKESTVRLPEVQVQRPQQNQAAPVTNNAQ